MTASTTPPPDSSEDPNVQARLRLLEQLEAEPDNPSLLYSTACVHDALGLEAEAVGFYRRAMRNGLAGDELRGAYLGLGSTYRTLGEYDASRDTFMEGLSRFPNAPELRLFLAMTRYNLGEYHEAVASLLALIADTTTHKRLKPYQRAIRFYAEDLDKSWPSAESGRG